MPNVTCSVSEEAKAWLKANKWFKPSAELEKTIRRAMKEFEPKPASKVRCGSCHKIIDGDYQTEDGVAYHMGACDDVEE